MGYKDESGTCQCDPLWYTEWCNLPYETCNLACRTCDRSVDANVCTTCFGGFYPIPNGLCGECDANCATCSGPLDSNCTKCHDGWYLSNGECLMCSPYCATCGTGASDCTSCFADSTHDSSRNTCQCNDGRDRDVAFTGECFDSCASGFTSNTNGDNSFCTLGPDYGVKFAVIVAEEVIAAVVVDLAVIEEAEVEEVIVVVAADSVEAEVIVAVVVDLVVIEEAEVDSEALVDEEVSVVIEETAVEEAVAVVETVVAEEFHSVDKTII